MFCLIEKFLIGNMNVFLTYSINIVWRTAGFRKWIAPIFIVPRLIKIEKILSITKSFLSYQFQIPNLKNISNNFLVFLWSKKFVIKKQANNCGYAYHRKDYPECAWLVQLVNKMNIEICTKYTSNTAPQNTIKK